ncbi:uncharacterized protein D12 isoform X2 [Plodia interpunctella]|uniref:uncharacterized protein D12 isoform X2 n=1 Tax=Plodia interpunctella TaxID=58824 RepID=UPI0023688138|nr:uncharacterized protein LOC128681509 isoform X2 [Plodia interpunctella]
MDRKDEYHDPDYAGTSENVKEEPPTLSEDERIEKIRKIIRREFSNELEVRENEVMMIDQRMTTSRRLLHRLRYALVNSYYRDQKLQLSTSQIHDETDRARSQMSSILREGQRRLHPSVRKLLGKRTADLSEIFKTRQPRSRPRPDYSAMLQIRNYTIAADSTKSLRPASGAGAEAAPDPDRTADRPRKQPRHLEPRVDNVLTLDEQTRNKVKHRYRIVIGNTSKYAPPASRADRSTHKWLLYVRDYCPPHSAPRPPGAEGVGAIVKSVTARLHHSYAPHHTVTLHKPPFHVSRRGWGEFTAQLELQFALPQLNPPASLAHTIKLDRNYTGLQTLGAETIVDVWLYSTPEMIKHAYQDTSDQTPPPDTRTDTQTDTITDPLTDTQTLEAGIKSEAADDSWMDFFTRDCSELDVDEMIIKPAKAEPGPEVETQIKEEPMDFEETLIRDVPTEILSQPTSPKKRIMKYIDPTTGKIYYLEMDRNLDLSTVQEIVINNTKETKTKSPVKNGVNVKKKKGISLLKPEVKNSIRTEQINASYRHIENDHCYLGYGWSPNSRDSDSVVESVKPECGESRLEYLRTCLNRLSDVRSSVYFLLKNIPLVDAKASNQNYQKVFPFVVESEEKYWKLDFAKRRNIEWSRAKLVSRLVAGAWRTKPVLQFARRFGLCAPRAALRRTESNIKELYRASDINSLSVFNCDNFKSEVTEIDLSDSDEEIDVVGSDTVKERVRGLSESCEGLRPLPQTEEERLRFLFVEKVCADIGIELRNEDIGNGYSHSLVHAVLVSATRSLAEELLRAALAAATASGWSSSHAVINLEHVYQAAGGPPPPGGGGGGGEGEGGSVAGRLNFLSAQALAAVRKNTSAV